MSEPTIPGERLVTQFTPDQRGWMVAALIAFLGVAVVGPALTQASRSSRSFARRTRTRIRRLGGGSIRRIKRAF